MEQTERFYQISAEMKVLIVRRDNGEDLQARIDELDAQLSAEYIPEKTDDFDYYNMMARLG